MKSWKKPLMKTEKNFIDIERSYFYLNHFKSISVSCDPYYVCARFKNGRHIPLPIILERKSKYKLQDLVLKILKNNKEYKKAYEDCLKYKRVYEHLLFKS